MGTGKTIVHVQVGLLNMGDGNPPWIPESDEIEEARVRWQIALGPDYLVVATPFSEGVTFYDESRCGC